MSRRKAVRSLMTAGAAGAAPAAWAQGRAPDRGPPLPSLTAALRGALDQDRQVFEVQGYERPNDGGAARWRLAQTQEAGPGRRLHAPSRRWFQLETDRPAPEMLGAAADWNGRSGRDNGPIIAELAAWAAGRPILLGPGRYLASPIAVDGPLNLVGQGIGRTVLVQADTSGLGSRGTIYVDSGKADRSVGPVVLRDFALDGRVETGGFEEFTHLVSLHGVSDVLVARLAFLGFRGDGLYLGSGVHGQEERHNRKVVIQDCRFDGRTRNNRNCISVLDVNGLAIRALFDFAWSLPSPWLSGGRQTKRILRKLGEELLPGLEWSAPKRGFAPPLDIWLRGPLRDWGESLIDRLDPSVQPGGRPARALWSDHLAGRGNHASDLWPALMLADWRRQNSL